MMVDREGGVVEYWVRVVWFNRYPLYMVMYCYIWRSLLSDKPCN